MTCYLCNTDNGWLILRDAAGNSAATDCPACDAGRRRIEAREAHATRYRPRQHERKAIVKRGASGKERAAGK